ncbi:hypothetical protein [Sinomicrobium weinanense]|uniref:Bacteriocin n=1 Tax=Sinomicrobium weinanense TaxID=2842200 RepID=A0A926JN84_9FLAO|nr:hypothetical protein [Sinomicrobium weinanense]MBC9794402.1 hypothetical protein [Sinomicrobium weinanense]MBU3124309.1 hypothetical protein [Sinomicrobium weinanense]
MKNLENYGVQELNATEMNKTNGGLTITIGTGGIGNLVGGVVSSVAGIVGGVVSLVAQLLGGISISGSVDIDA